MNELSWAFLAAARLVTYQPAAPAETVVLTLPFAAVESAQESAFVERADGLGAAAAFDPAGDLWIKVRQDGRTLRFSADALSKGVTAALPRGAYALALGDSGLTAKGPSDAAPCALATVGALLDAVYDRGARVVLPAVRYAALYEHELGSLCLLHRDPEGNYFLTHHEAAALRRKPAWFLAVNGIGFALRVEGDAAVIVSKPLAPVDSFPRKLRN